MTGLGQKFSERHAAPDEVATWLPAPVAALSSERRSSLYRRERQIAEDVRLGPDDEVYLVGELPHRRFSHMNADVVFAVVHKRHGCWTHLYRVSEAPGGGREAWLERVIAGPAIEEAARWAMRRMAVTHCQHGTFLLD